MKRVRFLMIGGFLGAGKTTTIARLARHYMDQGLRVGVVTNDQAYGLVDTESLRAQGFDVGEVTGACFCCKFNDLITTATALGAEQQPDVILAEPVGSCTDLVATVIEPLQQLYGDQYEVGPLAVLLKPDHGQKILSGASDVGFSPKAAYIFLKQLEEADVVVINKVDLLSAAEREGLLKLARERFADKQVFAISAREGAGFERLIDALGQPGSQRLRMMEVDYDVYAAGEAELGWLNCDVEFKTLPGAEPLPLDALVLEMVERLQRACAEVGAEPAHLKILGQAGGETSIANLVSSTSSAELSVSSCAETPVAELTVNARVAVAPETLELLVERVAAALAEARGVEYSIANMQRFRPGRPVPTHRMTLGAAGGMSLFSRAP